MKESQNIPKSFLLDILGDDQDDIFEFVNGMSILAIRPTSKGNYGIFRKPDKVRLLLQYTQKLTLHYKILTTISKDAPPIYTKFRWNVVQSFNFEGHAMI